ncbi:MAG: methyltransferase domain-containing protein, partial [Chromatiales bacterium]|nr:methyltransferase domain-containing protein [Chromatiales bacterium]
MTQISHAPWRCPVCQNPLTLNARTFRCSEGHAFDLAKEGYVNLLLANQRSSSNPGDDKMMSRSRRAFLEQGYYDRLADQIADICSARLSRSDKPVQLLDIGCGEGYYGGRIRQALEAFSPALAAVDISKEAVRMAAKRYRDSSFAVASNNRLPLPDKSVDLVYCVFSPFSTAEVARVLKDNGCFINVHPGPQHLFKLREQVYDQPQPHTPKPAELDHLIHTTRGELHYSIHVQRGDTAMNCSLCKYRAQVLGFEQDVGRAQESHHHHVEGLAESCT